MRILLLKQAKKDVEEINKHTSLTKRVKLLLEVLEKNPFQNPPPYEKLTGYNKANGVYSRRINAKHRLVYCVNTDKQEVEIWSLWTHYENI